MDTYDTSGLSGDDKQQTLYQVLPPMLPEQFDALKADIAERGVLTPIDLDEQGRVLDGHHRLRACAELGITDYPVFVRVGLSEIEKRTYARQVNTLRRHLTQAQVRELIAGQLRDTPEWADARIARALSVSDKTVRTMRRRLEATSEIPRLTTFEGTDGRKRPSTQPARAIFAADADDLETVLARVRSLPPEQAIEQIEGFLTANSLGTFVEETPTCSEGDARDWHLFTLFLVRQCGYSVDSAAMHVEWVRRRPFETVAEWLSEEAMAWRRSVGMPDVPAETIRAWESFAADHVARTTEELMNELRALNPALHQALPATEAP